MVTIVINLIVRQWLDCRANFILWFVETCRPEVSHELN